MTGHLRRLVLLLVLVWLAQQHRGLSDIERVDLITLLLSQYHSMGSLSLGLYPIAYGTHQ